MASFLVAFLQLGLPRTLECVGALSLLPDYVPESDVYAQIRRFLPPDLAVFQLAIPTGADRLSKNNTRLGQVATPPRWPPC